MAKKIYILLLLHTFSGFFPRIALAQLAHDGVVTFYMSHTDEIATISYLDAQHNWLPNADEKISALFHSREDGKTHVIDHRLIELADHLQDYFAVPVIEVICGYRSPEFNRNLKANGHNVANESFHTQGLAMDIHIDQITETALRDYLLSLKQGGVGFYGNKLMVHMDFGPVRQWQDGDFFENTEIGIFNQNHAASLRTDRLNYRRDSDIRMHASVALPQAKLSLEHFELGRWHSVGEVSSDDLAAGKPQKWSIAELVGHLEGRQYGKYRFHMVDQAGIWQNSNEFYVKKL